MRPVAPMPWDLFVFLSLTAGGFAFTVHSVLYPKAQSVSVSSPLKGIHRISPSESAVLEKRVRTIDIGCLERKSIRERLSEGDEWVRIKGSLCTDRTSEPAPYDEISISNLTNGEVGTVFFRERGRSFSTDYLLLDKGRNVISIQWIPKSASLTPVSLAAEIFR